MHQIPRPCVCTSVRRTARVLARTYDALLSNSGMNVTQLAVMRAIIRHPKEPVSHVAEDLEMERTSLYRALATLQRKRWVDLEDGTDGRSQSVSITQIGYVALAKADPYWVNIQTAIVRRFGYARWTEFAIELQRLADCANSVATSQSHRRAGS